MSPRHDGLSRPAAVLFDMDGTLVQSREAVWRVFAPISEQFNLGIDNAEDFYEIFTQNLLDGMAERCGDSELAGTVIEEFFQRLKDHYRPQFVPGMAEVIRALAGTTTLAVVTTNVMEVVREVLVDHGVATCFAHVFSGDVEPSKARVINHLKTNTAYTLARHCSPHYDESGAVGTASSEHLIMVTDTVGDVRAARSEGIRAVGVSWGMHSEQRLLEAGADAVALWPQELLSLLSNEAELAGHGETCGTACAITPSRDSVPAGGTDGGSLPPTSPTAPRGVALERVREGHELRRAAKAPLASRVAPSRGSLCSDRDPALDAAVRRIVPDVTR